MRLPLRIRAGLCAGMLLAVCTTSGAQADEDPGFHFGSYGRIRAATDLRGEGPKTGSFVAHGSRLDLPPYLELELRNTQYPDKGLRVRIVSTVAFAGEPFHYTGEWDAAIALRNMFMDVQGLAHPGLTLWAGSRMYRGDDVYLLDFWPLDNLNTVGGGVSFDAPSKTRVQAHIGTNRLIDGDFQYQERVVPAPSGFGWQPAVTLDRPRVVASTKITQFSNGFTAPRGLKASLYGEAHYLPSGVFAPSETQVVPDRALPSDTGFVLGAQGTAYGFGDRFGHVHLFARYARGIAAYGDLAVPYGLDEKRRASRAHEFLLATAANYERDRYALLMGAYVRRFRDASTAEFSPNHYWEGMFALRPQVYTTAHTGVGVEASYQFKNANMVDDEGKHHVPQAWRLSVIPFVTPMGWGSYQRPILFATYTATMRNQAAQWVYPKEDPRHGRSTEHYLGLHAEWWFDSSSYP